MAYIKVQNKPGFVRETTTTAIINKDTNAYQQYKMAKALKETKDQKIEKLEKKVEELNELILKFIDGGALNQKDQK